MSVNTYIQLDSTYRNRSLWPNPAEFVAPFSMSGRKGQDDAVDPVSLSAPIVAWTGNFFDKTIANSNELIFAVTPAPDPDVVPTISGASDITTLIIQSNSAQNSIQQLDNYYTNSVMALEAAGGTSTCERRVIAFKFLAGTAAHGDFAQVTVSPSLGDSFLTATATSRGWFNDPTDLSDTSNPQFFVPSGGQINNAYCEYILYNETRDAFRHVKAYDGVTGLLTVNTTGVTTFSTGPLPSAAGGFPANQVWLVTDNYSLRKIAPLFPVVNGIALGLQPTVTASTTSSVTINNITLPATTDFKNYVVRIIPNSLGGGTDAYYGYVNNLVSPAPLDEEVNILSWTYNATTGILTVTAISPQFTVAPPVGYYAELLQFSYDNENPYVYTGSQVSQQENVCYEVKLVNLILPNLTLDVGPGGRPAFYPYFYCELSNYSTANSGLRNILYSNNPNASRVTFACPIYDVTNPNVSSFVNIDSDSAEVTIKIKSNDNLYLRVTLPSGETFSTVVKDNFSPLPPNPFIQVSAVFQFRRVTNNALLSG